VNRKFKICLYIILILTIIIFFNYEKLKNKFEFETETIIRHPKINGPYTILQPLPYQIEGANIYAICEGLDSAVDVELPTKKGFVYLIHPVINNNNKKDYLIKRIRSSNIPQELLSKVKRIINPKPKRRARSTGTSTQVSRYNGEAYQIPEDSIKNASAIVYCTNHTVGDEIKCKYAKLLWVKDNHKFPHVKGQFIEHASDPSEKNSAYGEGQILIFNKDQTEYHTSWYVHNKRIPAWYSKTLKELISTLNSKKDLSKP